MSSRENNNNEEGSITPLLVGLCAVLLLLASVILGITTVHIERQKLQNLADQTSAASAVTVENIDTTGSQPDVQLTTSHVHATSSDFLRRSGAYAEFENLNLDDAHAADGGTTASVTVSSYVRLPLVSIIIPDGIEVSATGTARSILEQ